MLSIAKTVTSVYKFLSPSKPVMAHKLDMFTEDARKASFDAIRPKGKKRTSNAKTKKSNDFTWALQSPSIDQLAEAGFYYSPTDLSLDNVTCFNCGSSLDSWEEGDNAFHEHLSVVPGCAYAIVTGLERNITTIDETHDPLSEHFLEARKATFGTSWPFENQKGWTPKMQKLAEAGWHYFPQPESADFVKCGYCGLCLDGWEPKDKPIDEHKRRAPECRFFELAALHKKTRAKKSRGSKASRTSMQSVATNTQDESVLETSAQPDDSILTTATDVTTASTAAAGAKKGGRAKKASTRTISRSTRGQKNDDVVDSEPAKSELTEDEPVIQSKKMHGKKRTTADMQADQSKDEEAVAPPAKKRATRARASTVSVLEAHNNISAEDASRMEVEPDPVTLPKRGAKKRSTAGSRTTSRMASSTRQASAKKDTAAAAASKTTRQAQLDDGEIEAMLEADLDHLDDGNDEEMPDIAHGAAPEPELQPKAKRQPRGKGTKTNASKAPLRQSSRSLAEDDATDAKDTSKVSAEQEENTAEAIDESIVVTRTDIFANPYDDLNEPSEDEIAAPLVESQPEPAQTKGKVKAKKAPVKPKATTTKGKKGKTVSKQVEGSPEPKDELASPEPVKQPAKHEAADLRFSSPFEHEPPMLEEVNVSQEIVKHFGPKKPAPPSKAAKSTKTGGATKVTKVTQKSQTSSKQAQPKAKTKSIPEAEKEVIIEPGVERAPPLQPEAPVPAAREMSPVRVAPGGFPSPTPSPQSSNAENEPPSSRPSQTRPPLAPLTPSQAKTTTVRVPLAAEATTPTRSVRKDRADDEVDPEWALKSSFPWRPVDFETIFQGSPDSKQTKWFLSALENKENQAMGKRSKKEMLSMLTSPERKMTVEEWIKHNAEKGEEKLRRECERVVGQFESQGMSALKALEGIETWE